MGGIGEGRRDLRPAPRAELRERHAQGRGTVSDASEKVAAPRHFEANGGGFSSGVRTVGYGTGASPGSYDDAQLRAILGEMVNLLREMSRTPAPTSAWTRFPPRSRRTPRSRHAEGGTPYEL
ncbi:MAG: hypothetical protein ACLTSX_12365 [Collinsella sp.]